MTVREAPALPDYQDREPDQFQMPPLEAVRRSLGYVLAPALGLLLLGVVIGLVRTPTYTSEARLNVGGLDLTQESIQGYTTAVGQLSISYARAIDATGVILPVAQRLQMSPQEVIRNVTATPLQDSPVIAVDATSDDPTKAMRLADATSDSLVAYAIELNSGKTPAKNLLRRYLDASHALQQSNATYQSTPPNTPAHAAAATRSDLYRLQMQTAGALYQQSQAGQATVNLVQKLAPAASPTSDRASVLQQLAGGGLLAGLLIGLGLALWRGNRLLSGRLLP